jgi:hypothetical protein
MLAEGTHEKYSELEVDEILSVKPVGEVGSLFISSLTLSFQWSRFNLLRTWP